MLDCWDDDPPKIEKSKKPDKAKAESVTSELLSEIISLQQDYSELLGEEIHDLIIYAHSHGWETKRYEKGKALRDKIQQLRSEAGIG